MAKQWTKADEKYLKRYAPKMDIEKLAEKFEVSPEEIRRKEKSLGIIREHARRKKVRKKKVQPPSAKDWTKKEEQYLKNHFEKMRNTELAKKFKTTVKSVESKLRRMGLKRRRKSAILPEEERRRKIEEILRERHRRLGEERINNRRPEAIAQFDRAVRLFHAKKYKRAEAVFGKIVKDFGNSIDIVYKAKQYIKLCQEPS